MKVSLLFIFIPVLVWSQEWTITTGMNTAPSDGNSNIGYHFGFQYLRHLKGAWNASLGIRNDRFKLSNTHANHPFPDPLLIRGYTIQDVLTFPLGIHLNMALKKNESFDFFTVVYLNNGFRVYSREVRLYEGFEKVNSSYLLKEQLLYQGGFRYGFEGRYHLNNKKVLGFGMYYWLNHFKSNYHDQWFAASGFQFTLHYGINNISMGKTN